MPASQRRMHPRPRAGIPGRGEAAPGICTGTQRRYRLGEGLEEPIWRLRRENRRPNRASLAASRGLRRRQRRIRLGHPWEAARARGRQCHQVPDV